MKQATYEGYTFLEDGTVLGKRGKPMAMVNKHNRYYQFKMNKYNVMLHRVLYKAFNPTFDISNKNLCVVAIDGSYVTNTHLSNLRVEDRKDLIQGDKHKSVAKLTDKDIKTIKRLYKGKSSANQHNKQGMSYQNLADKYGVSKGNIAMIIKGRSRNKKDYKLK